MMKVFRRLILIPGLLLTLGCFALKAQSKVVQWKFDKNIVAEGEAILTLSAEIEDKWKLYSQHTPEGGPIPTEIVFEDDGQVEYIGGVDEEGNAKKAFSDLFELDVISFKDQAKFVQKIKFKENTQVRAKVRYMCCDGLKCIPPTVEEFSIEL